MRRALSAHDAKYPGFCVTIGHWEANVAPFSSLVAQTWTFKGMVYLKETHHNSREYSFS